METFADFPDLFPKVKAIIAASGDEEFAVAMAPALEAYRGDDSHSFFEFARTYVEWPDDTMRLLWQDYCDYSYIEFINKHYHK